MQMWTDVKAELRPSESASIYVPRDEEFEDIKRQYINQGKLMAVLRNIVPALRNKIMGSEVISKIDSFIQEPTKHSVPKSLLNLGVDIEQFFKFDPPKLFSSGKSQILSDDEFGRQVLAGLNPLSIERLKVFPPVSKLDPSIYGSVQSALKEEHIIDHIEGMSIQQALEENKLFLLDYHDIYLPFLDRINALDERKAYATTTIFFLTKMGTLKPIAIQLALPTGKQVLNPSVDKTSEWLWQFAKAHVCANDAGSAHSPDEEYIGDRNDKSSWLGELEIIDALIQFSMDMKNIEKEINRRNADPKLRNRCGHGVSPYELLIPSSGCGATGRG
ncbi:hypothetical protein TSUD_86580, partial [Trifolium subterraneum]